MFKKISLFVFILTFMQACSMLEQGHGAKDRANNAADKSMYAPIDYANKSKPGPALIVLPGDIKSSNATFSQKVTTNNIADFGELELSNANFKVYERSDLGPLLDEIALAANMGDPAKVKKILKRGKFKTTKWFVKFDILKAEMVAEASSGADLRALGTLMGIAVGGRAGAATGVGVGSVDTSQTQGVWIVGLRYKVIDANTTEQVTNGYFEQKMEVGVTKSEVMGFSQGIHEQVTLDTLAQRLVQQAVSDLDKKK